MSKPQVKEIIVVEGPADTKALQRAVIADTIETRGLAVPSFVLQEIERAQRVRGVIVFTDPDGPGEKIRRTVTAAVPDVKHAFIPKRLAQGKNKIGVEHADPEAILEALQQVKTTAVEITTPPITWDEYVDLGFVGSCDAQAFRLHVAERLHIGYANGKQFFKRLQQFQVTREELWRAMELGKDRVDE